MYLGIDLGTSGAKIVLVDDTQAIRASLTRPIGTVTPRPGWSEQRPQAWIDAVFDGLDELAAGFPDLMASVRGIGLSGQMHAVLLLDETDAPVAPAILWNDSRAALEARLLERDRPDLAAIAGVLPMPGFTGPKLLWLSRNRPELMGRARRLLFPKDYLRLVLTGEFASEVSDAAGSWLFDQRRGTWSKDAIAACRAEGLEFPPLLQSATPAGRLRRSLAERWGMRETVAVVAGAADVAAGCVGVGVTGEGQGLVSLGTSAQIVVPASAYRPHVERVVHSFAHALPNTWYNMAALLTGASALAHVARWTGYRDVDAMLAEVERTYRGPGGLLALPYLSGERTPHNDTAARGAFVGLAPTSERHDFALAMLEAVAFSLTDGLEALGGAAAVPGSMIMIGGGARSAFWVQMISTVLNVRLDIRDSSDRGPAFGAARLAMIGVDGRAPDEIVVPPAIIERFAPDTALREAYRERLAEFRSLYRALAPGFRRAGALDSDGAE